MVKKKTTSKKAQQDPHARREANKYENPIASREHILALIKGAAAALLRGEIAEQLALRDEESLEALRRRLRAMERDGQLVRKKEGYYPADKFELVEGRVHAHKDGFGFVCLDDADDVFLSIGQMKALWHGDIVQARISGVSAKGRREGTVVDIIERGVEQVTGRFFTSARGHYVEPDDKKTKQRIFITAENAGGAEDGQMVSVLILSHPSYRRQADGRVVEILGDYMAPGMETDVALRVHNIPHEWPEAVQEQVQDFGEEVLEKDKKGRVDLRELPLVTIDGEDARDFDDAVYCEEKVSGGWRLYVAIADVSHYVRKGSALDKEALKRGNSVYFSGRVVPMLPEVLSNGLCSLNPHVDRLCMVSEITISAAGRLSGYKFYPALMRSHARLTYTDVSQILEHDDTRLKEKYRALVPHLHSLYTMYQVLLKRREERGALDFETTELKVLFRSDRKIEKIVPSARNEAHRLIEECMLCANVATARFLRKHELAALYRVHEGPKADKVVDVRQFFSELGLSLPGGSKPSPQDYAMALKSIQGRDDFHVVQTVLLRSLMQAVYSPEEKGHFGLAYPAYTHFTSPIRRYPDLLVHRIIRHQLGLTGGVSYSEEKMLEYGEHCSMTERRADEATRDALDALKCEYMLDKIGEQFIGTISAVTHFGIFVQIKDVYIEGLVHVSQLQGDYYHFDGTRHCLMGERTKRCYTLGDEVEIVVANVNLDTKMIDFSLLEFLQDNLQRKDNSQGTKKTAKKKIGKKVAQSKKSTVADDKQPVAAKKATKKNSNRKAKVKNNTKSSRFKVKKKNK
ncbi:Ribonuclease R [Piscirickettsia salmonis]|uniref:Ribonuclease R n=2 Tax=Piscirickettsia salmonis TaxID=1238 RepID=A0A1L6TB69_PISSA|nr:ribonuclease R [Piscirickettsia salmonis]AKP73774.1 exoribonuclease R [Piscirickettsia salmonis LF-89 = ATCC VR-1361]ALB22564.1 exoribonuclease R [Piscirickettsia salmonis]ALY02586.1 exoribonuclease R [Piscirickettsia salmonis]AMA42128.1 exoribonuclease R [Piscirickettsia salmonis]AOS34604.1 exoribonuclease R [Piscirickettsia salmonis]